MFAKPLVLVRRRQLLALPLFMLALGVVQVAPASAAVTGHQWSRDIPFIARNSCTGEIVTGTMDMHFMGRITSGDGNAQTGSLAELHGQGVSDQGYEYVIKTTQHNLEKVGADSADHPHFVANVHVIRRGPGDDAHHKTRVFFTVNANGELTAEQFEFGEECRG